VTGLALRALAAALSVAPGFVGIVREKRDLVALRIAQVANIETRAICGAKARRTFVRAARGKCGGVQVTHLPLAACLEGDHRPVPGRRRASVEGRFDVEIRRRGSLARLDRQRKAQPFGTFLQFVAKGWQERRVEAPCARDVIGTDSDVGDHAHRSFPEFRLLPKA
jgi:hypothetical protein